MTEDEAKTKWCPFVRAVSKRSDDAANRWSNNKPGASATADDLTRDEDGNPHTLCIASACMAWRWKKVPNPDWKPDYFVQISTQPPRNPYAADPAHVFSAIDGHCGLAGQP